MARGFNIPYGPPRERASAANNWLAAIPGKRADNDIPNSYYRGRRADTDPVDDAGFRKTRGTQLGSTRRGPRGQKQSFRRFAGDNMGTINTMSVGKLVMGYLAVGLTFYVIGYGIAEGQKAAK